MSDFFTRSQVPRDLLIIFDNEIPGAPAYSIVLDTEHLHNSA